MPPARATVVPTPGPCKASAAARRPRQSACPGVPSCSQQPQNTARATGFSHTRQKPKAKSRAPAAWLPAASSLCPERPCRDGGGAQQKVGPLRWPGIEPGSTAWKAAMLTTIPPTLYIPLRFPEFLNRSTGSWFQWSKTETELGPRRGKDKSDENTEIIGVVYEAPTCERRLAPGTTNARDCVIIPR